MGTSIQSRNKKGDKLWAVEVQVVAEQVAVEI